MKRFRILIILILGVSLAKCSSDSNSVDPETLFVNGSVFKIGTNNPDKMYNDLFEDGTHRTIITIIENTEEGIEPNVIELDFNYEGTTVDGNYPIYSSADYANFPAHYVVGDYNTPSLYFGGDEVSGTIKITSLGNKKYKLEFNNATFTANDNSGTTRTITGYCQPVFLQ
jgi:hypothetical protein